MKHIAIHSVPRSGSTWLGSIFDSSPNVAYRYQPLFSYSHKSVLNHHSSKKDIERFFQDILNTEDEFVLQKEAIQKKNVPSFSKKKITHIVYKEVRYHHILKNLLEKDNEIRVIGLIRNPYAVINSWLQAPKEFKKELGWKISEEWRFAPKKNLDKVEEFNGFEKWKEVTSLFEELNKQHPDNFIIVKYVELLNNTGDTIRSIFESCNLDIKPQTIDFLNKSKTIDKSNNAYSVYRKKNNDDMWKSELNQEIINEITKEIVNTPYEKYV
jgi:DNA-directed RNA polymerase subunit F